MTRNNWKVYIKKFTDDVSKETVMDLLEDWDKNIRDINQKLNLLQDEIYKLNKEIN